MTNWCTFYQLETVSLSNVISVICIKKTGLVLATLFLFYVCRHTSNNTMFASLKSKIKEETGSDLSKLTSSWRTGSLLGRISLRDDSVSIRIVHKQPESDLVL